MKLSFLALLAAFSIVSAVAETPTYTAAEAAKHVGESASVTDKVEGVYQAKGGNIFLNMGGPHPNAPFTAFIPSTSTEKFPDFKKLDGATITVTGKITAHNDKAEIVLRRPDQLTVKEAAAETAGSDKTEALKAESPSPSPAAP
ncbi:MAG: hypothetical protein H0W66_11580 [Chthoniobacterales bacterium]|nr:hypothetical protein [Chthoniobacterales bacterium]